MSHIKPIRVAIIGGGLGGTVLMNALTRYPQLDVHLYESKSGFEERGASIGIAANAKRALNLLGLGDVVQKARGVYLTKFRICVGEGPDAQKPIIDIHETFETVHRAALLRELTASIPEEKLHFGKSLESISGDTLTFKDGSSDKAQVIIGADGIHSMVRKYVLGEGHPAIDPVFAGFWDCRAVMPAEQAIAKMGPVRLNQESPLQTTYVGNGGWMMHDFIEGTELVCVIAAGPTPADWDKTQWKRTVSRKWLDDVYHNFDQFGADMLDLLCDGKDEIPAFVQWESAEAPKLYNKTICMMGDAAHATTPWLGSGLAVSIEDSLILQSVLGKCYTADDIPAAFEAYDRIMRPRAQLIIENSREHGSVNTGGKGLDMKTLANVYRTRWDFITKWNTEAAVLEASNIFEQLKTQAG